MGDNGDVREDLRVPDSDLGKEIEQKFAAGEDILVSGWHSVGWGVVTFDSLF
jgi:translation initiation factor 5A